MYLSLNNDSALKKYEKILEFQFPLFLFIYRFHLKYNFSQEAIQVCHLNVKKGDSSWL